MRWTTVDYTGQQWTNMTEISLLYEMDYSRLHMSTFYYDDSNTTIIL